VSPGRFNPQGNPQDNPQGNLQGNPQGNPQSNSQGDPLHTWAQEIELASEEKCIGEDFDSRYEIIRLLDRSASCLVYKARDKVLDRFVAIKTLKSNRLEQSKVVRFQAEARTISALQHESIVRVLDFGSTNGHPYLVLDYVKGTTLSRFIRRYGPLPVEEAISLLTQVCRAMSHAHKHGVIHRDLKSSNIMLMHGPDGSMLAKVIDFGIAVMLEQSSHGITLTPNGLILGSPAYMSPEQITQDRPDTRSDIYSLGCVFFEAITGSVPFCS